MNAFGPVLGRIVESARREARETLLEHEGYAILEAAGLRCPRHVFVRTSEEVGHALTPGLPGDRLVVKVVSPDIVHKSDVGGVRVGVRSPEEVRSAYDAMLAEVASRQPDARVEGVLVQRQQAGGRETILGVVRDPVFGPLVMFGLGGVFVEVMRDVVFRIPPLDERTAGEMVRAIRSIGILTGARGTARSDVAAIADALRRLGQLAEDHPQIAELDVNPLVALEEGAVALDARVRLAAPK